MLSPKPIPEPAKTSAEERELLLQRIARRADELVRESGRGPGLNQVCWLLAEQELTGHLAYSIPVPSPTSAVAPLTPPLARTLAPKAD